MLSRYKIIKKIGSGGIGVVYRAQDLKLQREVAIKLLSAESFKKAHTLARFHREARLAASLNHPNVCTVHEIGESAVGDEMLLGGTPRVEPGTPFIVMEVVDGRTVDQVMYGSSQMALAKLLDISVQIADGLAEAHAKSIVHRDLKPKNVMVTTSGRVKILDFGMAKPLESGAPDDDTLRGSEDASSQLTSEGLVFGTVAYMSPEQATGRSVDSRSDIFSFGIMLYEMATGRKPFEGESLTSTLAKILETEPRPIDALRVDLPRDLSRIIHRCLLKNPADRYNDTRDLSIELKELMREISSGAVQRLDSTPGLSGRHAVLARKKRSRRIASATALFAVLLAGLAIGFFGPRFLGPLRSFAAPSFRQVTYTGSASYPTLSPDGLSLAYATRRSEGGYQVVVQDRNGGQLLPVFEASWIRSLRWSPSGSELLVSGSSINNQSQTYLVPRFGGATRPLPYLPYVAWAPEGDRYAGATLSGKQIRFTETSSGNGTSIELTGEFSFVYEIDWSPRGTVLAFRTTDESDRHAIWTTTVDGATQQPIIEGVTALYSPRFSPRGDAIYYLSGFDQARELHKIEIDLATGKAKGRPKLLLSGLQAGDQLTFSRDGRTLFYPRRVSHANLWMLDKQPAGLSTSQLTRGTFRHAAPRFSPDGLQMALIRGSSSGPSVFVMSLVDRRLRQLTFLGADVWHPVWSPDGEEVAFGSTMDDASRVWRISARGGAPLPFANTNLSRDLVWGPGAKILYQRPGDSAMHLLDPGSGTESNFMGESPGGSASYMASPEYSPDGKQVAFSCDCPDGEGIWVASLQDSSSRLIHESSDTRPVGWSADGAWVYALAPSKLELLRIPSRGGAAETHVEIPFERVSDIDVTPDGNRVAVAVPETQADIWLIENFDPDVGHR